MSGGRGSGDGGRVCPCCAATSRVRYRLGYGRVWECGGCGHAMTELASGLTPESANASAFGSPGAFGESASGVYRRWARERLAVVSSVLPSGSRLLEIGPGGGEFLREASRAGYRITGLDRFDGTLEANRSAEFSLTRGDAETFEGHGEYDGVAAFHVLEHLPRPRSALRAIRAALRPGGMLVLEVPNYAATARRLEGAAWSCFVPYHVQHFSPCSLSLLCGQEGFRVRQVSTCGRGGLEELAGNVVARVVPRLLGRILRRTTPRESAGHTPAATRSANRPRRWVRHAYWAAVAAVRLPFRPVSGVERRLLHGGNLRVVAERAD